MKKRLTEGAASALRRCAGRGGLSTAAGAPLKRGTRRWLFVACTLLPLADAGAAEAQWSVQAGAGYTSGLLGAELTWRPSPAAVSLGAGMAGIGARFMVEAPPRGEAGEPQRSPYVGAGYLLMPWTFGSGARGVAAVEFGTRILHPSVPLFADLAAGAALVREGDGGATVGPVLRLQLGVPFRGRGTSACPSG
jgi:hypothetical protein